MSTVISAQGVRLEWLTSVPGLPAGAVMFYAPDGTVRLLDPQARRYWTISGPATPPGEAPRVTTQRTGETAEVSGVPTERLTFEIRLTVPDQTGTGTSEVTLEGDAWVAAQYRPYTMMASSRLPPMQALGLDALAGEGLQMRQTLRSDLFGGRQVETTVTSVAEEVAAPDLLDVPAGYEAAAGPFIPGS
jgi:hypothetical protein